MEPTAGARAMDWSSFFDAVWRALLHVLPRALLFSAALFVVGIALLVLATRRGWLSRRNRYWGLLVHLYYLYVPVVFICLGLAFGLVSGAKSYARLHLREAIHPASKLAVHAIAGVLDEAGFAERLRDGGVKVGDFVQRIFGRMAYTPKADTFIENQKAFWTDKVLRQGTEWVFELLVRKLLSEIADRTHLGIDVNGVIVTVGKGLASEIDFSSIEQEVPDIMTEAVHSRVQGLLTTLYANCAVVALLFLLPVIAETVAYRLWFRDRPGAEPPTEGHAA